MKKLTKILSYLLTTTILSSTMCLIPATELKSKQVTAETLSSTTTAVKPTSKIIYENVKVDDPDNVASVVSALNSTREETTTSVTLQFVDSFFESVERPTNKDITIEEAQEILHQQRTKVKAHYSDINAKMVKALKVDEMSDDYFVSSYAPFIFTTIKEDITAKDVTNIQTLAKSDAIATIYVRKDSTQKEEANLFEKETNITPTIEESEILMPKQNMRSSNSTSYYDASDITIGMLDTNIVDVNNPNLSGVNIETAYANSGAKTHPTGVASIITGNLGVAENPKNLISYGGNGDFHKKIEGLIKAGANVINLSYSAPDEFDNMYLYLPVTSYIDYLIEKNWVTIVAATGTSDEEEPTSDTLYLRDSIGYNMITVGSCNDAGIRSDFSCYLENATSGYPDINAPHIVAFGEYPMIPNVQPPNGSVDYFKGTSFAAPFVTGGIAVLMQKNPMLMLTPFVNRAMLMASANLHSSYKAVYPMSGTNDEVGAGKYAPDRLIATPSSHYDYFIVNVDDVGEYIYEKSFVAEAGQEVRVALSWLAHVDKGTTNPERFSLTDYDLYLYNSDGTIFVGNSLSTTNTELILATIPTSGGYTIKVKQYSARKTISYYDEDYGLVPTTPMDACGVAYYLV